MGFGKISKVSRIIVTATLIPMLVSVQDFPMWSDWNFTSGFGHNSHRRIPILINLLSFTDFLLQFHVICIIIKLATHMRID